jgi:hypothetical protein
MSPDDEFHKLAVAGATVLTPVRSGKASKPSFFAKMFGR